MLDEFSALHVFEEQRPLLQSESRLQDFLLDARHRPVEEPHTPDLQSPCERQWPPLRTIRELTGAHRAFEHSPVAQSVSIEQLCPLEARHLPS